MKILHLGDLHIGKKVKGFNMLEDQLHIFSEIYKIIEEKKVECVVIAGDVYDRSVPSEKAVEALDNFLDMLINRYELKVIIIGGNHDSGSRLSFSNKLLEKKGLYIVGKQKKLIHKISVEDVDFYLYPFTEPSYIRGRFKEELDERKIRTHEDSIKFLTEKAREVIDEKRVNIAIYHGFIIGGDIEEKKEDSVRDISVGGEDGVSYKVFSDYDYVALGHLHSPMKVKSERIRYSGSLLPYSFSEVGRKKYITLIDIKKEKFDVDLIPTKPLKEMRIVEGTLEEVAAREDIGSEDYLKVVLKERAIDPMNRLRKIYKNIMELGIKEKEVEGEREIESISERSHLELIKMFSKYQGIDISSEEEKHIEREVLRVEGEK